MSASDAKKRFSTPQSITSHGRISSLPEFSVRVKGRIDPYGFKNFNPRIVIKKFVPTVKAPALSPSLKQSPGKPAVSPGKNGLNAAYARIMPCIPVFLSVIASRSHCCFSSATSKLILSLPLKWGKRFRYKAGNRNCHLRLTRFFCSRKAVIKLYHILCKLGYTFDILLGFGRRPFIKYSFT